MRVNAKITYIDMDSDSADVTWQTEHNEIIDSFLIHDNYKELAQRLIALKFLSKNGLDKKTIYATTFNIRIYPHKDNKGWKVAPESCQLASDVKYVYVEPSNVTTVAATSEIATAKPVTATTVKTIAAPVKTTVPVTQSVGRKSFTDKVRAAAMGKIGATKLQNKLALKRAQGPLAKLSERIKDGKLNSPSFIESFNQFNRQLSAELKAFEK